MAVKPLYTQGFVVDGSDSFGCSLVQTQERLHILVAHPCDAQRGRDLEKVGRQALVQTANALITDRLSGHVDNSRVGRRMHGRALCLQPCAEDIERINDAGAEGSRGRSKNRCGDVAEVCVVFVDAIVTRYRPGVRLLEELERADIDGAVREHADKTEAQAAVGCPETTVCPHVLRCAEQQRIACWSALDCLALQSEFECVDGVDAKLGSHAADAASNELGDSADLGWVVVAFVCRKEAF